MNSFKTSEPQQTRLHCNLSRYNSNNNNNGNNNNSNSNNNKVQGYWLKIFQA